MVKCGTFTVDFDLNKIKKMNSPINSLGNNTKPGYQPLIIFHSYTNGAVDNNFFSPLTPALWKKHPVRVAHALAQAIRIPLSNINLSVEILESTVTDNELKVYLEIIARNSARINKMVNKILQMQTNEVQQ